MQTVDGQRIVGGGVSYYVVIGKNLYLVKNFQLNRLKVA